MGDSSFPDVPVTGPSLPTCATPLTGTSAVGDTLTLSLDTGQGGPGTVDLAGCGSGSDTPQVVIAYTVPGTGPMKVLLDTQVAGTAMETDTVLSVRTRACDEPDVQSFPPRCFDDFMGDLRAKGAIPIDGGETIFIIVTTYTLEDAGPIQLDITTTPNVAPTLDEAFVRLVGDDVLEVEVTGGDEDGNADGVWVSILDTTRGLVDLDGDGVASQSDVRIAFLDTPVTGATRFTETATIDVINVTSAFEAYVRLTDEANALSEGLIVPVETGMRVGFGDACDGTTTVCPRELVCTTGICQPRPAQAAACAAAPALDVAPMFPGSVMGVLMPGTGSFRGPCGATSGTELFYTVDVPAGGWDLILSTDAPGTAAGADTVVYVRSECTDPGSTMDAWCNDDAVGLLSTVEMLDVPGGSYTVFVEDYAGVAEGTTTRFELTARLRPVLDTGAACDPDRVLDRCRNGDCPRGRSVCL
jgi:hypothetical protein